ncbi:DUF2065 domain-containing protein [Ponticaulis sp.]|uniref:DUF2065 domain-containing protein n=1 Tax=Ponticaulis sp. TaxID=2020902 RepID=UPI000B6E4834|nr:DUF2065 domain-containing protein [Ponticaulis sp.]MAI91386.1 DUF2065 domain-containing protein [Ponticaulis sp.]OUX97751.1 MAG: hypothetical protein CBB65_13165 [Hyphomonadaceae bacterium TMED5]|tara:strand:- start:6132 stop:6326 length:195 start_codon:yes stop_codon:yes gene_type:complete
MSIFIFALGLLLAVEGLLYAIAPIFMKKLAAMLIGTEEDKVRQSGIIAATLGAVLIYIAARFFR